MRRYLVLCGLAGVLLTGCGGNDAPARPGIKVSAASSLNAAFTAYGEGFPPAEVRLQFAASDELAAQIRGGAHPDVYAAANDALPAQLAAEGLVDRPVPFATNRLVVAVVPDSPLRSVDDLARSGVAVAVGQAGVPIGD